jgi:hypothetical protein
MRRTIALAALTLFALTGATTASAAGDSTDACKSGGFSQYVDPVTGKPFANQGVCVSFVNAGGTLVPVSPTPPAGGGTADIEFANPHLSGGGGWYWDVKLSGLPADTVVEVSYTQNNQTQQKGVYALILTHADGTASLDSTDGGFGEWWRYGPCDIGPMIRDITVRGAGFQVTEALPVPPAC